MPDRDLADFNQFLYQSIPLVRFMQLQLISCNDNKLIARAPAQPNLNDKQTIFGGSSSALMTVCGWSLIKFNLEQRQFSNDVVIANAQTRWRRAQKDELLITAEADISWPAISEKLNQKQKTKINVHTKVDSAYHNRCTVLTADFVILNNPSD